MKRGWVRERREATRRAPRSSSEWFYHRAAEEKGDWLPDTTTRVTAHGEASGPGACPLTGVAEGAVLRLARDLFETSHKAFSLRMTAEQATKATKREGRAYSKAAAK